MNLLKIRKYLIRQQYSDPKLNNPDENIERFKKLSFKEILEDLNMTRSTYLDALRTSVKGKYTVFHQRSSSCLNVNNYNPSLLLLNRANMDLTWISGIKNIVYQKAIFYCRYICNCCIHLGLPYKGNI